MVPLLLLALAAAPGPVERAAHKVTSEFERIGRTAPIEDPRLDRAAEAVARRALEIGAKRAADPLALSAALSAADAFDPSPRAILVRADPPLAALDTLLARTDLNQQPASAMGVAYVEDGQHGSIALLLIQRKASLDPFPRRFADAPASQELRGKLIAPLEKPDLFVTTPDGAVSRITPRRTQTGFCAKLAFPVEGRHTVEVLGTGPSGPEVAALFFVDVGTSPPPGEASVLEEPPPALARDRIRARINALRAAHQEPPVEADPALDTIAQAYSEQMAHDHFFAHVDPAGKNLRARLVGAGYAYSTAGENLGLAEGPLAAHFGIELSPGHRKNLLEPAYARLGLGIATEHIDGREQTLVTEILAKPLERTTDPIAAAYHALDAQRAALHLPPLSHANALEPLARAQATFSLKTDFPEAKLPGPSFADRVFATVPGTQRASMDLFITQDVGALPTSKSVADVSYDRVAVAAVKGNSPTFGPDKFWVVVIYAGSR
jgi:uncharacterized protein YkwD